MNIFKRLDGIFFTSFLKRLEYQQSFLLEMKKRNMSVDDGLKIVNKLMEDEKCNILV